MTPLHVRQVGPADLERLVPLSDQYRRFYGRQGDSEAARQFV